MLGVLENPMIPFLLSAVYVGYRNKNDLNFTDAVGDLVFKKAVSFSDQLVKCSDILNSYSADPKMLAVMANSSINMSKFNSIGWRAEALREAIEAKNPGKELNGSHIESFMKDLSMELIVPFEKRLNESLKVFNLEPSYGNGTMIANAMAKYGVNVKLAKEGQIGWSSAIETAIKSKNYPEEPEVDRVELFLAEVTESLKQAKVAAKEKMSDDINPIIIYQKARAIYFNPYKEYKNFMLASRPSNEMRKWGWQSGKTFLELAVALVGSYAVCAFVPTLNKIATGLAWSSSGLSNYSLMPSFSGLGHNIFSANIVGTVIGVAVAYKNYEMWDEVAKELGKRDEVVTAEATALKTKFEATVDAANLTPQRQGELKAKHATGAAYAQEMRKFFKDHPYVIPCLKYATTGSLGVLSLLVETKSCNWIFAFVTGGNYLATSAITHYLTNKQGDPLAVQAVKVPASIAKAMYEAISDWVSPAAQQLP